jgi:hypothetical protein
VLAPDNNDGLGLSVPDPGGIMTDFSGSYAKADSLTERSMPTIKNNHRNRNILDFLEDFGLA